MQARTWKTHITSLLLLLTLQAPLKAKASTLTSISKSEELTVSLDAPRRASWSWGDDETLLEQTLVSEPTGWDPPPQPERDSRARELGTGSDAEWHTQMGRRSRHAAGARRIDTYAPVCNGRACLDPSTARLDGCGLSQRSYMVLDYTKCIGISSWPVHHMTGPLSLGIRQ